MLAGIKFIPSDQVEKAEKESSDLKRRKSSSRKEKHKRKKKTSNYSSDDGLERIKKGSRKSKKWYSSDEHSLSESESDSKGSSQRDKRKYRSQKKKRKRSNDEGSGDEGNSSPKKTSRSGRRHYFSEDCSSSSSEYEHQNGSRRDKRKRNKERQGEEDIEGDSSDENNGSDSLKEKEIVRKEMGLEWMLRPAERTDRKPMVTVDKQPDELPAEETPKVNPRELNPYLKDNGSGYPEDADGNKASGEQLFSSSLVGDGGASWRLKALKRAQEQAAREGRRFEEVVEARWGSLGQLAVSAASHRAAPSRAHLYAIKNRKKGQTEEHQAHEEDQKERYTQKTSDRDYLKDVSLRHPKMRAPKAHDSLSWRKQKHQNTSTKDASTISAAVSGLNKFANDGNFMLEFNRQSCKDPCSSVELHPNDDGIVESDIVSPKSKVPSESTVMIKEELSANKVAAKAMQLRLKGKHEEAEKLLQEAQKMKANQGAIDNSTKHQDIGSSSRYVIRDLSVRKKKDDDADKHLAQKIMQNKQYSLSGRADDEYDFEDGPSRKSQKKREGNDNKGAERAIAKRILTQQERCLFCFENPNRLRHLANGNSKLYLFDVAPVAGCCTWSLLYLTNAA